MATPSNPSGIVPNADEVSKAPQKNKTPTTYDEYYKRIQKRTWTLYKKIKSDDVRIDVDKKLMDILEDVEKISELPEYKGKKDPVWGLLDSTYEGIAEGYDKETGQARYKSEDRVLPDRPNSNVNKGALKAKVRGQVLADYAATVEDRRLTRGQSPNASRTPNTDAGGDIDESGGDLFDGDPNSDDSVPATQQKKNQEEVNKIKVRRDDDDKLLPSDKELLTKQKKIADKALETGKWHGIDTKTGLLHPARNNRSKLVKPEDRDFLRKISSKIDTILTSDVKEIEVDRPPPKVDSNGDVETDGLLKLSQQIRPKADVGVTGKAKNAANRRNMEASLRNSVQGPLIPRAVDEAMEKRKDIADLKMMPQSGGPVYSPNAGGLNAETGVRERLNSNVRTPIAVAQGDTRIPQFMADYERSVGRNAVGVIPEIDRMTPPAPTGNKFEQPPIRLGPQGTLPVSQPALIPADVGGSNYDPKTTPIANFSAGTSEVGIPEALKQAKANSANPPFPVQDANPNPVNQPMTRPEQMGVQERMGYSPKPEVNPNAGIKANGAGSLIPPANVNARASGLGPEFTGNNVSMANQRFDADPKMREMETDRVRANNVRSGNLKGPFETQLDSASNTEVLSDNDTRIAKAEAQLEDLPEKRRKQIRARIKKIGGLTTGLVGIIAAGTASAARYTGTDAGNATADYIDAGMEAYVDNVTMRGYEELGADREKMLGSDLSLTQDISRGIIPDTIADVAGLAGLISSG